ncbi:MAG: DUF4037 domain-containing protein [Lachnospiraceae bacterium]|nr:DUF4037 domain-containing protein [Lachnospiraceae bacterium]
MDIKSVIEGLDRLFADRESEKVEDYLSVYLEQALTEGDAGSAITIINELIGFYRDTSQYDKAEAYCGKLLPFMERAGLKDTIHYGTSCLNIANAYRASGKLEDSYRYYQKVFEIYEKVLDEEDFRYASLYNNLALLHQENKEFGKACEALEKALSIVRLFPEAVVEFGVTYTNLAASYMNAGNLAQAEDASDKGLAIFQNGLEGDYHYSAALCVAGDIYFAKGEYEKAVSCYEKGMLALKGHVGLTHAYFRIVSNLQTTFEKMGRPDSLKGLVISKDYYETYGKKAFREMGNLSGVAFAKVGEGSECFGLDDLLSKDHDFGPGFCVFVTKDQYEVSGKQLEEIYASLPAVFRGFEKPDTIKEAPRNGVIVVEDFFGRILSLDEEETAYLIDRNTLPEKTWLRLSDWQLRTVTNGEIFDGDGSAFGNIYKNLKKGYPESVKKRKMAQLLGEMSQSGQYNYQRMMRRQDVYGAAFMLHGFESNVIEFLYLVNDEYAPHDKWLMKEAESLKKGREILNDIKELMGIIPDLKIYQKRDMIDWIGKDNEEDPVLYHIDRIARTIVNLLQEEGFTKSSDPYLEQHIPYLFQSYQ